MILFLKERLGAKLAAKTTILLLLSVVFFFALGVGEASAQRRFSKTYPANNNVKLQLSNRSGTVEVEGWDRQEVSIQAYLETPAASIVPQIQGGVITINCVRDNMGRTDVGSVNFRIHVPYDASVDIETKIGNLSVSSVRGYLVRARIYSDGDITLTNISADNVIAENMSGNIFFDGDIASGGTYRFSSIQGDINLRVPFNASFRLVATAPSTRRISLGSFGGNMRSLGDGRRVVGQNGDGSAALTVTNQRGTIAFIRR
jgi:DUF4097 and DUF4098 domain-containing protein YvlB